MSKTTGALALTLLLAAAPIAGFAQTTATSPGEAPLAQESTAAMPAPGPTEMQAANTILATQLIGTDVYSGTDESIGEIENIILTKQGAVEGVVIGVGGFLGMGVKDVAVDITKLTITMDPDDHDDLKVVLATSRKELEDAPEYEPEKN